MKNILMNTEMTKAILDGRKVHTRRVIKKLKEICTECCERIDGEYFDCYCSGTSVSKLQIMDKPKYKIGEVIWVREPAKIIFWRSGENHDSMSFKYLADGLTNRIIIPSRLVKSLDYPKWITSCQGIPNGCIKEMARIFLRITNVRVERLQECYSFEHLKDEGISPKDENGVAKLQEEMQWEWQELWNKTSQKGYKWDDNPYVFVYEFERIII